MSNFQPSKRTGSPVKNIFQHEHFPSISHGFVILTGRIEPISCLVFYLAIKMWENLYKKAFQKWQTALKTLKKHQNVPTGTHKKRQILFQRFLGEYTLFPTLLLFWIGEMKISNNWIDGGTKFLKNHQSKRKRERENTKFVDAMEFCHFNLITISCPGNWYYF